MVAFSSAAQIGYIYMGIGIGGTLGYAAAMFQILAHAFTKSLLFLTTTTESLTPRHRFSLLIMTFLLSTTGTRQQIQSELLCPTRLEVNYVI